MATVNTLASKLHILRTNPSHAQRLILRTQTAVSNGETYFVEASNPAIMLLESTIAMGCAQMMQADALMSKTFESLATSAEDLYHHMSDTDYLDRFSVPGECDFTLYFSYDEILSKAVPLNDGSGIRLLTIPKHTQISVANTTFTFQYPIDIRVLPQGGLSILYNTGETSPIEQLLTNVPDWNVVSIQNIKLIKLGITLKQMVISSNIAQLNSATGFVKDYSFVDDFYYARVYTKNEDDGTWVEIATTHTEQVYDIQKPTAVLKLLDGVLRVYIPQIYFNNLLIKDSLRIDIYGTKGPITLNLSNYDTRNYSVQWIDRDNELTSVYSAPFNTISGFMIVSTDSVTGGFDGLAFDALRERIIDNTDVNVYPITNKQLLNPRNTLGYNITASLDNITNRQYLASKNLPAPANEYTVTAIGCGINTLQTTFTDLITNNEIVNHGRRLTIKPSALFKMDETGVIKLVDSSVVEALKNPLITTPESLANTVNASEYLFTPFYYVLDSAKEEFDIRPYRLDDPKVVSKYFDKQNTSLLIDVSSKSYAISLNPTGAGYILAVELYTSKEYNALALDSIALQLRITPPNTTTPIYVNGALVSQLDANTGKPIDNRYIFHFNINTNFDIDENNNIILSDSGSAVSLTSVFELVYIVRNHLPPSASASAIDNLFDPTILPGYQTNHVYKGLVSELFTIEFGVYLKYLWNRARSLASSLRYVTYSEDIQAVYTQNVYAKDALGNIELTYNAGTGEYVATLLHAIGDPVLDSNNQPVIAYKKGDTVLDGNGDPILVNQGRDTLRQFDMLFLDGKYYFATNKTTTDYLTETIQTLSNWITEDIDKLNDSLLDLSELYFYPKRSMGDLTVYTSTDTTVKISASHSFKLVFHVKEYINNNPVLKDRFRLTSAKVLSNCLATRVISRSGMIEKLKDALGEDVLSVSLSSNIFSDTGLEAFTLVDDSNLPVVGKQLVALSNQTLAIQDSVTIDYVVLEK